MTSRLAGNHQNLELARMERMTDEEVGAEMVEIAVQAGFDAEAAAADRYAALSSTEEQLIACVDALPEDERAELVAAHGDPREGRRLWPKSPLRGDEAEAAS